MGRGPCSHPNRKHRDIEPKENVADALKRLCERFGCLLIFPHPDQPNGLCKSFQPAEAAKLLKEISADALEHCPEAEVRKLQSTGVLSSKFFERLSLVEFSDPKCIDDIGTKRRTDGRLRATYLKLSAIDEDLHTEFDDRIEVHTPGRPPNTVVGKPCVRGYMWFVIHEYIPGSLMLAWSHGRALGCVGSSGWSGRQPEKTSAYQSAHLKYF